METTELRATNDATHTSFQHLYVNDAPVYLFTKRIFDFVMAIALLILLSPLLLLIAAVVRFDSNGPAIFRQIRVGRGGRQFVFYKFRTMVANAEEILPSLQHLNSGGPMMIRIPNDPRVTRLGRILRKTGLDELPQLINVITGEMSLVGPRPQDTKEVALYNEYQRQRLLALPGITGLWQVSANQHTDFNLWVHLDLEYIRRRSFWFDLKILSQTLIVLLRRIVS